jgi:hypothetical protein
LSGAGAPVKPEDEKDKATEEKKKEKKVSKKSARKAARKAAREKELKTRQKKGQARGQTDFKRSKQFTPTAGPGIPAEALPEELMKKIRSIVQEGRNFKVSSTHKDKALMKKLRAILEENKTIRIINSNGRKK